MIFEHRSFIGNTTQLPSPEIHFKSSEGFCIVVFPWGDKTLTPKLIEYINDKIATISADSEATNPFSYIDNVSSEANSLRTALLSANQYVYNEINKSEFQAGFEVLLAKVSGNNISIVQIGRPHLFLFRKTLPAIPLCSSVDLSIQVPFSNSLIQSLPSELLGVSHSPFISMRTFKLMEGDKLGMVSKSLVPRKFYSIDTQNIDMKNMNDLLSEDASTPFWIGLWQFENLRDQNH